MAEPGRCEKAVQGKCGPVCFSVVKCDRQELGFAASGGARILCRDPFVEKISREGYPRGQIKDRR